jgi:hypothetical protein
MKAVEIAADNAHAKRDNPRSIHSLPMFPELGTIYSAMDSPTVQYDTHYPIGSKLPPVVESGPNEGKYAL